MKRGKESIAVARTSRACAGHNLQSNVITLEVGDIKRFVGAGDFASYCRTVEAKCTSNSKKKGQNRINCVF